MSQRLRGDLLRRSRFGDEPNPVRLLEPTLRRDEERPWTFRRVSNLIGRFHPDALLPLVAQHTAASHQLNTGTKPNLEQNPPWGWAEGVERQLLPHHRAHRGTECDHRSWKVPTRCGEASDSCSESESVDRERRCVNPER